MKLKNLFFMLLAIPMVFVACDAPKDEAAGKTELILSETSIEAEAEGGPQLITFEIKNAVSGKSVAATCEAAWVNDIQVADYITFNIDANTEAEQREAKLVVTYDAIVVEVAISQKGKPASTKPVFTVDAEATYEYDCKEQAGFIYFTLENPIADVVVEASTTAEWISQVTVSMESSFVSFLVAANEGEARTATVTLKYGILEPIVVTVSQAEWTDVVYTDYKFVSLLAEPQSADTWDIVMTENDPVLGAATTRISVKLTEGNAMLIPDGTYSVENGGILTNTYTDNSFSTFRYNSDSEDIIDATIEVTNDCEAESTSIKGTFAAGDKTYKFEFEGKVDGFIYKEISDEGITEWTTFTTRYGWDDVYMLNATATDLKIELRIHELGVTKSNHGTRPSAGEYIVSEATTEYSYIEKYSSFGFINGSNLESGSVTFTDNADGSTTVSINIVDERGINWKGTYTGTL